MLTPAAAYADSVISAVGGDLAIAAHPKERGPTWHQSTPPHSDLHGQVMLPTNHPHSCLTPASVDRRAKVSDPSDSLELVIEDRRGTRREHRATRREAAGREPLA